MTKYLKTNYNRIIAYNKYEGKNLGIVFLSGLRSDMNGHKALELEDWAKKNDHSYLRFDYSGHGLSSGNFKEFLLSDWIKDSETIINELTDGPQVVIGSSMGGWIMLNLLKTKKIEAHSIIGLATAADFTKKLIWDHLSFTEKKELIRNKKFYLNEDLSISYEFIKDGQKHLILNKPLFFKGNVYLYHGQKDLEVPYTISEDVFNNIIGSNNIKLILEKHGEHRLSKKNEILTIKNMLSEILQY